MTKSSPTENVARWLRLRILSSELIVTHVNRIKKYARTSTCAQMTNLVVKQGTQI